MTPGVRFSRECRQKVSHGTRDAFERALDIGAGRSADLCRFASAFHSFFAELSQKAEDVEAYSPDVGRMLQETGFRLEALGYLVYRHVVSLRSVEELLGGMITLWWTRIKPLAERDREKTQNPRMFEWAQWLAERVAERRTGTESEPAFRAHADWH